jgi:hypothetical protein
MQVKDKAPLATFIPDLAEAPKHFRLDEGICVML